MEKVEVAVLRPVMMSVPDAGRYLGCSKRRIETLLARGRLPCVRYSEGARARRFVPVSDLDKFLEERLAAARAAADPRLTNERLKDVARRARMRAKGE